MSIRSEIIDAALAAYTREAAQVQSGVPDAVFRRVCMEAAIKAAVSTMLELLSK